MLWLRARDTGASAPAITAAKESLTDWTDSSAISPISSAKLAALPTTKLSNGYGASPWRLPVAGF